MLSSKVFSDVQTDLYPISVNTDTISKCVTPSPAYKDNSYHKI